nr:metallophosphoesterase [uncultured Solibaculum sp.]
MSLFAISDPHLSLGCNKPMDIFRGWQDYVKRLEENWRKLVGPEDTVVLPGDISWGMTLEEAKPDLAFLDSLPGTKLIGKGNHDYWWATRRKMDAFLEENGFTTLRILFNDAYAVGNVAVCGTRGWFYDAEKDEDKKVLNREIGRLNLSVDAAEKTGLLPIAFLHYPPVYAGMVCGEMISALKARGIKRVYYGHIHGEGVRRAVQGIYDGIDMRLISCDFTGFAPVFIES